MISTTFEPISSAQHSTYALPSHNFHTFHISCMANSLKSTCHAY